jgi:membrane-bound lytic murein transglycosylase B
VRRRIARFTRTSAELAIITPLVFAGAVGATPRSPAGIPSLRNAEVTPLAAVAPAPAPDHASGPAVVAARRPPTTVHVAATAAAAPPPATMVHAPGTPLRIPAMALSAYRNAEQKMAASDPNCGISWNLLAGIGRIESLHANGGATDPRGTAIQPIFGPALDGSLPGNEVIVQSSTPTRVIYARAMGPMQFLPGTWSRYASDGDGDGKADPQNLFDSTLSAARYLCSGGLNLRDQSQVMAAILRYNNSMPYARNVLGWAAAYTTGVVPVDLPPMTGPPPPLGDVHLEYEGGVGPESPLNAHGLPSTDPLARTPLIDLTQPVPGSQQPNWPWPLPNQPSRKPTPACSVICIEPQAAPPAPEAPQPPMPPYAVPPPSPMPPYAVPPPAPMPPYAVPDAPPAPAPPPALLPPPAPAPPLALPPPPAPPAPMPPFAVPPPDPPPGNGPLLGPPG